MHGAGRCPFLLVNQVQQDVFAANDVMAEKQGRSLGRHPDSSGTTREPRRHLLSWLMLRCSGCGQAVSEWAALCPV